MEMPIPFGPQMEPDADPVVGAAPIAVNAIWDGTGFRRRRGLTRYTGAPSAAIASTAIIGLHLTAGGKLIAVDSAAPARNIYVVTSANADSLTNADGTGALRGSGRPVFAETESILAIAGGENLVKVDMTVDPMESSLLGGTQGLATHIVANNGRLVANNLSVRNRVNFSATAYGSSYAGFETWLGGEAGFKASDARADYVVALGDNANEVFAFGRKTTQAFAGDQVSTYHSVTARDYGCSAPYSLIRLEDVFSWLDQMRRVVISDGRAFEPISMPVQADLNAMATVEDAYGYRAESGLMSWRFEDGRTFVFDIARKSWSLAMGWNTSTSNFQPFGVTSALIRDDSGACLVGTSDGKILLSADGLTDDDGTPITMELVTGFVSRGTMNNKLCKRVRLNFRRGIASADAQAHLSWRDGSGAWSTPHPIYLRGAPGDFSVGVEITGLGAYRMRQWRLRYSGPDDVVFAGAVEDFDVGAV